MNDNEEEDELEEVISLDHEEDEEEEDENEMEMSENSSEFKSILDKKTINLFNEDINNEIKEIYEYLEQSIQDFHKLFNKNLKNFDDALKYLESISKSNNCVCSGIISNVPAWRCNDCCEYESAIYCSNCYKRSKHLHKNHKIYYLYASGGMCDCGDPDSLSTFCPQHSGPYVEQSEIDQFVSKVFSQEIITNLTKFFDEFFLKFSKFFILINNNNYEVFEKDRAYQKLINFFRKISSKNSGMFHLLSKYFLKNHFKGQQIEDKYKTTHSCLKINKNDIEILYKKENNNNKMEIENENNENSSNKHICECNFMRLFFLNWSCEDIIKKKETQEFIMQFTSIFPLKKEFCITLFYDYEHFIHNNYSTLLSVKTQFFSEEITVFIAEKSTLIEESFEIFYNYFSNKIKSNNSRNSLGDFKIDVIKSLYKKSYYKEDDIEYFSKPKIRELVGQKGSIIKRIIDCICLIHNESGFESFFPHPEYQNKGFNEEFINLESKLLSIIEKLSNLVNWKDGNLTKDIFQYIVNKIMNQEKEGIKQLKEKEYSFHLILYRCFGILLNYFCYYYSLENNCTLIESIKYFKSSSFKNHNEINLFAELIINDYYKLFGFVGGGINRFFNYYDNIYFYYIEYFKLKNLLKMDFTLLKYLFIISENNFSLISLLQTSNLENVFPSFKDKFLNNDNNTNNEQMMNIDSNTLNIDENIINQWKFILEIIIIFMKDDSSPFWTFMREYENVLSSKTKNYLFENVKKNKNAMVDLENILKEQIIHIITAQGNLSDLEKIKKYIDDYLITLFGEQKFNEILDELTFNKTNKGIKMFYLKDSNLKYLDINYYIDPKDKSNAQKYILDFKKDAIKPYNNYYYSPSQLSFDFFLNIYEKVLLNKDNLNTFIAILQKLLSNTNEIKEINSMRNIFLPVVLNYLSIFGCINTKSFLDFKNENSILINNICQILSSSVENKIIDRDTEDYAKDIIEQLNRYKVLINNNINPKEYDYNTNNSEILNLLNKNGKSNDKQNSDINNEKSLKSKNIKEHLKNLMKNKAKNFMNKAKLDDNTLKAINENNKKEEINNDSNDEIMCFFCRNNIKLKSFKTPYGKAGYLFQDFFYFNCIKSTVKSELKKLKERIVDDKIKWISIDDIDDSDNIDEEAYNRIISCGHYFHQSCFKENFHTFIRNLNCPLCLKKTNLLIPPLNNFRNEYSSLKSQTINKIFNRKTKIKKKIFNKNENLFTEIIFDFIKKITSFDLNKDKISANNYDFFIDDIFLNYKSYINFLENIFYVEGTYFNKYQQINIIQNFILSLRYLVNNNIINIDFILKNINDILNSLMKGPGKLDAIIANYENMYYINILEKLLLYLSILFNFNEMKNLFKYIINLILPYFSFGFYLRSLIIKNDFYSLYNSKAKEKIDYKNITQYFTKNNKYMIKDCFNFLLQKLLIIRIITDFDNINEDILNNFNNLSTEKMISLVGIDNLYKSITKNKNNEISFNDIFKEIPKLFKNEEAFNKQYSINYKIIFESIINNILKKKKEDKYLIRKELFVQFSPLKFDLINLDDNIFDLVEKNLEKKCISCSQITRQYYICLICGNKICQINNEYTEHIKNCNGKYCIFLDMANMEISIFSKNKFKTLYPLYVNDAGVGPSSIEIGNEFKLSKEKLSLALRTFICNDFSLKLSN